MNDETRRIRRLSLFSAIALMLVANDLRRIYKAAGRLAERQSDLRRQRDAELASITDHHIQRIAELRAQLAEQRANGHQPIQGLQNILGADDEHDGDTEPAAWPDGIDVDDVV